MFLSKSSPWNSGASVISLLWLCFCERKWPRFCSLCAPVVNSTRLFPSTFLSPHLFLLLLDTALPIPLSSLILSHCSTHNPTFQHNLVSSSSSSSFILFPHTSCQGLSLPRASKFTSLWQTECVGRRAERHVLWAVCTQVVYMLMASILLCVLGLWIFFVRQHSWHVKLLPCWSQTHKRCSRQRDYIDCAWVRKPYLM